MNLQGVEVNLVFTIESHDNYTAILALHSPSVLAFDSVLVLVDCGLIDRFLRLSTANVSRYWSEFLDCESTVYRALGLPSVSNNSGIRFADLLMSSDKLARVEVHPTTYCQSATVYITGR